MRSSPRSRRRSLRARVAETSSDDSGGDEFAVVLPGAGLDAAENLAQELETLLRQAVVETLAGVIIASASVGVASTEGRRTGIVRLLAQADIDMYRRKKKRKAAKP